MQCACKRRRVYGLSGKVHDVERFANFANPRNSKHIPQRIFPRPARHNFTQAYSSTINANPNIKTCTTTETDNSYSVMPYHLYATELQMETVTYIKA